MPRKKGIIYRWKEERNGVTYLRCSRCKSILPETDFSLLASRNYTRYSWCKECGRKQSHKSYHSKSDEQRKEMTRANYLKNRDKILFRSSEYQAKNRKKVNQWSYDRDRKLRNKFFEMYGGKCDCCGESEPVFLVIDHVLGQIGKKKKEFGASAWRNAVKEYRPDLYRILCQNCNMAIRFGRICPHQLKKDK